MSQRSPITRLVRRVGLNLIHPWRLARTDRTFTAEVVLLELRTDDGLIGRGEAAPVGRYNESPQTVETFLNSVSLAQFDFDNLDDELKRLELHGPGNYSAKCALNVALLDLAAQRKQLRLCDYFGLGFTERKHVTSFTIGIDNSDVVTSKVVDAKAFPVLKIKVGVPLDRENLRALRDVSPEKPIRLDANEGWKTKEEALRNIEELAADTKVQFVEQPLPASASVADCVWLKRRSPLPVFADESYHSAADASRAAECFHGVNVKLVKTGGVSAAFEALQAARKAGLKTMLGCMIETSVLISAAAHLAELCDYLDLDGNLLISNDPFRGVSARNGILSFAAAPVKTGICIAPR